MVKAYLQGATPCPNKNKNMTETKFRIFTEGKIRQVVKLVWEEIGHGEKDLKAYIDEYTFCHPKNLMQFTGLYDENKKEIYEGDIVKFRYSPFYKQQVGKIIFDLGMFAVLNQNDLEKQRNQGGNYVDFAKLSSLMKVEVIGNIFENSDLLK